MSKTIITIGPADHGRSVDLDEFTEAERQDERVYELSRGIVTVVEIPKKRHMLQVASVRDQLQLYKSMNPGRIEVIASGNECKLTIPALGSERHPDLAIYLTPPPDEEDGDFWLRWVPEIVIEVVSPSSRKRDYEEKPDEYLRIGVKEYWIVDADILALTVMRRSRARWAETKVAPPEIYRSRLLPGLAFSIESVFKAAGLA
jgi:Uma2 family endonuclease